MATLELRSAFLMTTIALVINLRTHATFNALNVATRQLLIDLERAS